MIIWINPVIYLPRKKSACTRYRNEAVVSYTTQMDAARQGIVTPEMEIVAAKENMGVEKLRERLQRDR